MSELLRSRIKARLDALGINVFEAERRAGFKRGFLNDLFVVRKGEHGYRKDTIRTSAMRALARALECEPEYLLGQIPTPRYGHPILTPLAGVVEPGVWRSHDDDQVEPLPSFPVSPDPRYPEDRIKLYVVRGDHAGALGITAGSVVWVLHSEGPYRDGDIVLARRDREDQSELSIRVVAAGALSARPLRGTIPDLEQSQASILGLVVSSIRVFGLPNQPY